MGYFSLDIKKAKGTSDTTQSDHIERKIMPKNADPTRTHLNMVLVEYPDGVHGRDEAIAHRLNTAGIRRKITHDQVRVVRVVLSGTHEDMMNIQEKGKLDEWCNDSIQWLQATFGKDHVVAAHLHMDEKTPHIHAAVVPIVTGERRKAKKEQTDGKRKYRKKTNSVRYRDLKKKNETLETETRLLQEKKAEAQEELKQVKAEIPPTSSKAQPPIRQPPLQAVWVLFSEVEE